jgi:galactose mutarotase-like enzyme
VPSPETPYAESCDIGGYDERFPTLASCRVPGHIRGFGALQLPDRGELWSQQPEVAVVTDHEGSCARTVWRGERMPYRFSRIVKLTKDGTAVFEYAVVNDGPDRLPFLWAAFPLFPLTPDTELAIPDGSRTRVRDAVDVQLGDGRSEHRWPFIRAAGRVVDLLKPYDVAKRYACTLFIENGEGQATIRQGGHELTMSFDKKDVSHLALWINKYGWLPVRDAEKTYCNFSLAPASGAPDTLTDALGAWKTARWIEPGEVKGWRVEWRAKAIVAEANGGARSEVRGPRS